MQRKLILDYFLLKSKRNYHVYNYNAPRIDQCKISGFDSQISPQMFKNSQT